MNPRNILILTASHLCRNPRVVKEATTLGAAGHAVTVMTLSNHPRFEQLDLLLMRGLPFRRVTLDYAAGPLSARMAGVFQRGATWTARRLCRQFGLESAHALGPAPALLRFARAFPADLTIVHTEIPIWAAQHLLADGRRVAVDMEDWHSEDLLPADRRNRPLRLLRAAEAFVLQRAIYSSATSQSMADALAAAFRCPPPVVLRNSFPLQTASRIDRPATTEVPRFIWFSQTVGPGRGLEAFIEGWARMTRPSSVHLLGDVHPGYREELLARLPSARQRYFHFIPLVAPADLPAKLAEFDLGLALELPAPVNRDLTITNKILQYLNAGLAVVATDTAGQREVMTGAPDAGLLVPAAESADPARFAARLDSLLAEPDRLRAAQLAARAAAKREYCWEKDSPRLLAAVDRALANPPPAAR